MSFIRCSNCDSDRVKINGPFNSNGYSPIKCLDCGQTNSKHSTKQKEREVEVIRY
jgi:hypothetical protein